MSILRSCLASSQRPAASAVKSSPSCSRRYRTSVKEFPTLPPGDRWRSLFPTYPAAVKDRVSLSNVETASTIASSFLGMNSIAKGKGKTVIEAFPGPGALSRALLQLPQEKIDKLIILEDYEPYLEHLYPLAEIDPRVTIIPKSGFDWDTYLFLEEAGHLKDIEQVPWEGGVHPQLHFISHIPHNIKGEQLMAQFFRCMPDRSWLFKFGRMPLSFVLGQWVWETSVNPDFLLPYDNHFHPTIRTSNSRQDSKPESRRIGHPLVSVNIVPHAEQVIDRGMLDKWDFCLRKLFVLKSTPLKSCISSLAPGAQTLLKMVTDPSLPQEQRVDITKSPRQLTIADWALLVRAFDNWPFAPDDLMISAGFGADVRKSNVRH